MKQTNSVSKKDILKLLMGNAMMPTSDIVDMLNEMKKENMLKEVMDTTKIKKREDDGRYYIYVNRKTVLW